MTVVRHCREETLAVVLNPSAGEFLSYEISDSEGSVFYSLADHENTVLMDDKSCPVPCTRRWPRSDEEIPDGDRVNHVLAIQFIGDGRLEFRVEKRRSPPGAAGDGSDDTRSQLVEVIRDCELENSGSDDDHFEPITVLLTGS